MPIAGHLSRGARRWWITAVVVLAVPAVILGGLWMFQRRLIYQPDTSAVPPAAQVLPGAIDVTLHTADGLDLGAWYLPASEPGCRTTVLVLPGNAGNRWGRADLASGLAARGYGVLLVDYRGYGGNPGSPSEAGLDLDADAAAAFLDENLPDAGAASDRVLYLGESLGSSPATGLALRWPPAGVLLRSPFTDLAATAAEHYPLVPVRWLLRETHPVLTRVTELAAAGVVVDVVYGSRDSVVPAAQSRQVADAASAATPVGGLATVVDADHNDPLLAAGPPLLDAVGRLVDRVGCRPAG